MKIIQKVKSFFKFLILLIIVFVLAFFIAGGTNIFDPAVQSNIKQIIGLDSASQPKSSINKTDSSSGSPATSGKAANSDVIDSLKDKITDKGTKLKDNINIPDVDVNVPNLTTRAERAIFLKKEVAKKLNYKNWTPLNDIPEAMQQAIISVEDNKFYEHNGFNSNSIVRAALVNLQYGEIVEGASTITQQLIKNMFLGQEQTFGRKAEELLLALDLEMNYSKDEILEMYLNTIYFGSGYYGIKEAAQGYFGKEVNQLNLAESTMLAGIPNAPSIYSPYEDFKLAKERQAVVIDSMVRNGYIRSELAEITKQRPLSFVQPIEEE